MLGRAIAPLLVLSTLGGGGLAPGLAVSAATQSRRAADTLHREIATRAIVYRGRTSQHEPISFQLTSGALKNLSFWIVIRCKSQHRYRMQASGFIPIVIHAGRFRATVRSPNPPASATVTGRRHARRVTGTLALRRYAAREHGFCTGTATFSLKR
jgi:hypothetical protein